MEKQGRPKVPASRKRTKILRFFVTKSEDSKIREAAKKLAASYPLGVLAKRCPFPCRRREVAMAQKGFIFRSGPNWFLNIEDKRLVDGVLVTKQECVKLAAYGDRYRRESDLD